MTMPDPFLSQFYQTNSAPEPSDGDTLEKMAQLHLLEKLAEDQEIDLTEYSDDEILGMTDQVFGADETEEFAGNDMEKEAAARFEEADYLGRVMAHSMWNELDTIQKMASRSGATSYNAGAPAANFDKAVEATAKAKREAADTARQANMYGGPAAAGGGGGGGRSLGKTEGAARTALHKMKGMSGRKKALVAGGALLAGGALAAGGVAGAKALKRKKENEKTASALDTLSDGMAFDILASQGFVDENGGVIPPGYEQAEPWNIEFTKTASAELDEAVEELAWMKLSELGYVE